MSHWYFDQDFIFCQKHLENAFFYVFFHPHPHLMRCLSCDIKSNGTHHLQLTHESCRTSCIHCNMASVLVDRARHNCLKWWIGIVNNMQLGLQTDICVLGFSKAFDKMGHRRLVEKLRMYGIDGETNITRINNRSQSVLVEGACSSSIPVIYGVPQSSCLFLFYTWYRWWLIVNSTLVRRWHHDLLGCEEWTGCQNISRGSRQTN